MTTEPTPAESFSEQAPVEADILARWRLAFGKYSNAEIASRIGSSRETVRRISHGQLPTTLIIARACLAFGIRAEWILLGKGPIHADSGLQLAEASLGS